MLAIGYAATVVLVNSEVKWSGGDPTEVDVAGDTSRLDRKALGMSHLLTEHPMLRAVTIRRRVAFIQQGPGHCRSQDPLSPNRTLSDHVVAVRLYTLFAIPFETIYVTCGGSGSISYKPPPGFTS